MTYHKCDKCGKEYMSPLQINLTGYKPNKAGGILLPEPHHGHEFCSAKCFIAWMKWALENDTRA